ncbi:MAG: nicotinamidase [Nitrospirae bacterium]|nr:MAG: nicotinamidase [Nitrospirota bacterium]
MKLTKLQQTVQSEPTTQQSGVQLDQESGLVLVDLQNDFFPGGALGVKEAHQLIPKINAYIRWFHEQGLPVIATRDWHPANHCSFREQGGPWPVHCVQGSWGAQFHPDLVMPPGTMVVSKGTDPRADAYSGFDGTSLQERLHDLGVRTVCVLGLATDYCVKQTVIDACRLGFRTIVLTDAIQGVEVHPGDCEKALEAMRQAGATTASAAELGLSFPS